MRRAGKVLISIDVETEPMDKNRKILISILSLLVVSAMIAIVDISLKMQKSEEKKTYSIRMPEFGPGVGIVRIDGEISLETTAGPFGLIQGAEAIVNRLNDLEHDSNIRTVVVRINSPGGTVGATQEIYQKLWRLRKKNIPLVASMGDLAASGGYYVASACNSIMANYGTLTGSIGVIISAPDLQGTFEKLGIKMNVIKSGQYKDILSSFRDMTFDEKMLIQGLVDSSYKKFLKDVALGRNMNQSEIEKYADGRIMGADQALQYKLIDAIGTFEDAIDLARKQAKLSEDAPVYDDVKTPFQQMLMGLEGIAKGRGGIEQTIRKGASHMIEYRYVP